MLNRKNSRMDPFIDFMNLIIYVKILLLLISNPSGVGGHTLKIFRLSNPCFLSSEKKKETYVPKGPVTVRASILITKTLMLINMDSGAKSGLEGHRCEGQLKSSCGGLPSGQGSQS